MADSKKETIILDFEVDSDDAVVSIEKLTAANKALREERKKVDLSTDEGIKRVKDINKTLDQNNQTIKANSSALEQQRLNVGRYTESIKDSIPFFRQAEQAQGALSGGMSAFNKILLASGIGLFVAALGSVIAYLKGSEEGQNKWNKVLVIASTLMEKFMDVAESIGEILVGVFEHPMESLKQFGAFLTTQIVNRFVGMLELIPNIGKAIGLLFEGKFVQAGKTAGDAVGKVVLGINGASDKIINFSKQIVETTSKAIDAGTKMANWQAQIDKRERELVKERAEIAKQVLQIRTEAIQLEGIAKEEAIARAIELEEGLSNKEVELAQIRANLASEKVKQNGADKEALDEEAKAIADVANAEASRFANTLKLNKELEGLRDKMAADEQKRKDDAEKATEKQLAAEKKTIEDFNKEKIQIEEDAAEKTEEIQWATFNKKLEIWTKAHEKELELAAKSIDAAASTAQNITDAFIGHYKVQENELAVSLANQKTELQEAYKAEIDLLAAKFNAGEISKEEYDEKILGLNAQYQADVKAAEIEQAKALNEIKRKEFEANKKNNVAQAIADAAQAVLGVFAKTPGGFIIKGIAAALAATFGAIRVAQIKNTEFVPTTFRQGGYTGDGDVNELAGLTHKKEFVMPAEVVDRFGKDHFQSYLDGAVVANGRSGGGAGSGMPAIKVYTSWKEFKDFENEMNVKASIVEAA